VSSSASSGVTSPASRSSTSAPTNRRSPQQPVQKPTSTIASAPRTGAGRYHDADDRARTGGITAPHDLSPPPEGRGLTLESANACPQPFDERTVDRDPNPARRGPVTYQEPVLTRVADLCPVHPRPPLDHTGASIRAADGLDNATRAIPGSEHGMSAPKASESAGAVRTDPYLDRGRGYPGSGDRCGRCDRVSQRCLRSRAPATGMGRFRSSREARSRTRDIGPPHIRREPSAGISRSGRRLGRRIVSWRYRAPPVSVPRLG
jgi:hypothetical protein